MKKNFKNSNFSIEIAMLPFALYYSGPLFFPWLGRDLRHRISLLLHTELHLMSCYQEQELLQ